MFKSIVFILTIATSSGFVIPKSKIPNRFLNKRYVEISNHDPSFIVKTLSRQGNLFGNPQSYSEFLSMLKDKKIEGVSILSNQDQITGLVTIDKSHPLDNYDVMNTHFIKVLPAMSNNLIDKLEQFHVNYNILDVSQQANPILNILTSGLQLTFIYIFAGFIITNLFSFINGGGQGQNPMNPMNMLKKNFDLVTNDEVGVTFNDVAGCNEAKLELEEVVDFLKQPEKYEKAGAKIPKGILLEGPPGTGKTLLARAVAGEANVNFLYASGSQFIEMFVGVGASRVRDLFGEAKKQSPCVIFLDEIDAVGRQRGAGLAGGNDEREQTLNEILTNMDGFVKNEGVIVIAATNRADILDSALTRPGRFDRKINVGLPDIEGRKDIIDVHFKNKQLQNSSYLENVATLTNGFSGADIANLANEAAILSVRFNETHISPESIYKAFEKITIGLPSSTENRPTEIVQLISAHEIGHALLAYVFKDMFDLQRVTINSNKNGAGGYTLFTPNEKYNMFPTKKFMLANLIIALGGRAAEEIIFKKHPSVHSNYRNDKLFSDIDNLDITTGASNDLKQANSIARRYVSLFGMGNNMALYDTADSSQPFLGRDIATNSDKLSEYSKETIDKEIETLVLWAYATARSIIEYNIKDFYSLKDQLVKEYNLSQDDFEKLKINYY